MPPVIELLHELTSAPLKTLKAWCKDERLPVSGSKVSSKAIDTTTEALDAGFL